MSRARPAVSPPVAPATGGPSPAWICALIFFASLLVYLPALNGGFLWDDNAHVTPPGLRSLAGLFSIWFEVGVTQQYYPLLHSAFWLEHRLWGEATLGYHLINVLLHATTACLFGRLLQRLAVPGAWFAALLFAVHPVAVESVAWITEQKNTLSAVFYLSAALAYLRFSDRRVLRTYALATFFFVLALLTKSVTATLPAALLVIAWWQHGRLDWRRDVRPLLPWLALGIIAGLFTAHFEHEVIGAQGVDFDLSLLERSLLAGRVVWFYLGKLVWPVDLIFIYPRWPIDAAVWWQWLFPLAALALLGGLLRWRRPARGPLAAALLFGGTLFPVLGFVNVFPFRFSYVADHFQYLASLAIFALVAAGLARLAMRWPGTRRYAAAAALLSLLATLSWAQSRMYRDVFTLYGTTLTRNPSCWLAHNNLAMSLVDAGRVGEALPHLEAALNLRPAFPEALSNLGDVLIRLGRPTEAVPQLQRAVELRPGYSEAQNNLGNALLSLDRPAEALAVFERALEDHPDFATAHCNLGLALATLGRTAEAFQHFETAIRLDPHYADPEFNWAIGLSLANRFSEAVVHFEKAIELQPDDPVLRNTYGQALAGNRRPAEALVQFQAALRLAPDSAETHLNAALILQDLGRTQEARDHYAEAIRLNPQLAR